MPHFLFSKTKNERINKMKRNVRLKICVAAMAALFMPLALYAQTDGFFSTDNGGGSRGVPPGNYEVNSGSGENPFDFDDIGGGGSAPKNEGPVGSGLLIMVAAGAGYLELKRKEEK